MTSPVSTICVECGSAVDATLLGGTCPRCLLGDVMTGGEETRGEDFDGHELLGEIARGGMGVVYRARQLEPDRVVALKTLRAASLDSPEAMGRFKHEAEIMVALDHAAILPVYQCGEMDGIPFFTMKLVEGGTLAERIGDYSGKWRAIAELMATVCDGVRHAHERGVLHRDLKPGNILFDSAGHAYVSDFGIAKLADSQNAGLTMTMSVIGTPHYLAPEIAAGSVKAASVTSDVWSLGVILYELLTGDKPFKGESVTQVLRALDLEQAPAPTKLRADVPRDLEVITLKALSRDPARRYASAQAFADDLRAWLEDRPITARAVPLHERAWMWARRNPRLASTAALLVLAVFAAAASLVWGFVRVKQENARVIASEAETRVQLRESLMQQAHAGRIAREMGWRDAGLKALREAASIRAGDDVRDEAIAHLAGFDLKIDPPRFAGAFFASPSFDRYAVIEDGQVVIRRMADDVELWRLPPLGTLNSLDVRFDPQHRWLAVETGIGVTLFAEKEHRELARWPGARLRTVSVDGEFFLLNGKNQQWLVIRSKDGTQAGLLASGHVNAALCDMNTQPGRSLLGVSYQSGIKVIDWMSGDVVHTVPLLKLPAALSWCGDDLVASLSGGQMQCSSLRRGLSTILGGHASVPMYHLRTDDGALLITSALNGDTTLWHHATGECLVRAHGVVINRICTDGRRITTSNIENALGEIQRPASLRWLRDEIVSGGRGVTTGDQLMALSVDGRWVAFWNAEYLAVHETATGRMLACQQMRGVKTARFTPDGRGLWVVLTQGVTVFRFGREGGRLRMEQTREITAPGGMVIEDQRFSADGSELRVILRNREMFQIAMQAGAEWRPWKWAGADRISLSPMSESPDGRWIVGVPSGSAVVRDAASSASVQRLDGPAGFGRASFSPDGRWLVFSENRHQWHVYQTPDWARVRTSGAARRRTGTNIIAEVIPAAWSPRGDWFAVSDGMDLEIVETGGAWRTLARLHGPLELPVTSVRVMPVGSSLLVMRTGGSVEIWDLRQLATELHGMSIAFDLPPPAIPPPTPEGLDGPFDAGELPPLQLGATAQGR